MFSSLYDTLRPRQNGRHFADDIFKCIFIKENIWISIKISLKFVPKGPINKIPGDKPLSEAMFVSLLTHICVTQPQWVKSAVFFVCFFRLSCILLISSKETLCKLEGRTKYYRCLLGGLVFIRLSEKMIKLSIVIIVKYRICVKIGTGRQNLRDRPAVNCTSVATSK